MSKDFPYGVIEPCKIPDTADKILDEFFQITKELGIQACLGYGLCLGFYRDGGYIPGDNDLDVYALVPMSHKPLLESLNKHGFKEGASHGALANNTHFYRDQILLDIYFRMPEKFKFPFDIVQYKEKKYPMPNPVEEYLSKCYSNWKVKSDEMGKHCV